MHWEPLSRQAQGPSLGQHRWSQPSGAQVAWHCAMPVSVVVSALCRLVGNGLAGWLLVAMRRCKKRARRRFPNGQPWRAQPSMKHESSEDQRRRRRLVDVWSHARTQAVQSAGSTYVRTVWTRRRKARQIDAWHGMTWHGIPRHRARLGARGAWTCAGPRRASVEQRRWSVVMASGLRPSSTGMRCSSHGGARGWPQAHVGRTPETAHADSKACWLAQVTRRWTRSKAWVVIGPATSWEVAEGVRSRAGAPSKAAWRGWRYRTAAANQGPQRAGRQGAPSWVHHTAGVPCSAVQAQAAGPANDGLVDP